MQNGGFVNKIQVVRLSVAKIHRHVFENPGYGERIVINDCKPGGLITSIAINMERDQGEFMKPVINRQL